jgi:hypothetical protein
MKNIRRLLLLTLFSVCLVLAACSQAPELIAAYPVSGTSHQNSPHADPYHYEAVISMDVRDVDDAEESIARLAQDFNGYMTGTSSYWVGEQKYSDLTLELPFNRYNDFRQALDRIGDVTHERLSSYTSYSSGSWDDTRVTISLSPNQETPIKLPSGWRPLTTLESAFQVFLTVFGFIVDILIWIVVVAGPFALLAWIIVRIVRRFSPHFRK